MPESRRHVRSKVTGCSSTAKLCGFGNRGDYNDLTDVVLWFGIFGMKIIGFLSVPIFGGVCCVAMPLHISECCPIWIFTWFLHCNQQEASIT